MAEATTTTSAPATTKAPVSVTLPSGKGGTGTLLSPNGNIVVFIEGRVNQVNKVAQTKDGRPIFETVVFLPAPDSYSNPRRYCVSSYGVIGRPGDDISIDCELVCQPWRPRSAGNNGGDRDRNAPPYDDGYAGNNYQRNNNARNSGGGRWHYPHYLWAIG